MVFVLDKDHIELILQEGNMIQGIIKVVDMNGEVLAIDWSKRSE